MAEPAPAQPPEASARAKAREIVATVTMPPPDKERRPPGQEKAADHDAHGGGTKDSVTEDLNIARGIAAAGIPVAVAYPDP
jgi:hypothetical protein